MMNNKPFNIMAFPAGPICNLNCDYCYYLDKTEFYPDTDNFQMDKDILEKYIKQYVDAHPGPVITFGWQGGEPTIRGLDFFKKAVELEKKYVPKDWEVENAFQTNGLLIDDSWAKFFKDNDFLVGISIDGPAFLHDVYRKDKQGKASHNRVIKALDLLQSYGVDYNVISVIHDVNVKKPLEVYNFLKNKKVEHIQFIPLVETCQDGSVSTRSVQPQEYGKFLIEIYDQWLCQDYGKIFIQFFEQCVSAWAGVEPSLCIFSETCGKAAVMEHNGDLYSCDHFVFPEYKLGNINKNSIGELISSSKQEKFGRAKKESLPRICKKCDYYFICHGGCLRARINTTESGEEGLNYLCEGYKQFFNYADPFFEEMVQEIRKGKHPSVVKNNLQVLYKSIWKDVGRNDPCPCGSGKKYKKCCLERK